MDDGSRNYASRANTLPRLFAELSRIIRTPLRRESDNGFEKELSVPAARAPGDPFATRALGGAIEPPQ